jgi:hypothetical protein
MAPSPSVVPCADTASFARDLIRESLAIRGRHLRNPEVESAPQWSLVGGSMLLAALEAEGQPQQRN